MKTFNFSIKKLGILCAAAIVLVATSCKKDKITVTPPVVIDETIAGPDVPFFAVTLDNQLISANAKNAASVTKNTAITGLQADEKILAIDFRPATGQLYGVGSTSRIYVINTETAVARAIGTSAFTPAIDGAAVGFDFNPTVDRIRLVSTTGQNLRLNPETGTVAFTDGVINGATGATVTAAAYTNNKAGAATTVLFVIDVANDKLYKQDPPNNGMLVEIGKLGFDVQSVGGFDISPDGATALAVLNKDNKSSLYSINLETGKATKIKNDFTSVVTSIAIPTQPVAYAISAANELVIFNPTNPVPVAKAITGIQAGENILGMDMRPVNGQLYAIGSTGRLYTINASSGVAAQVGTAQAPLLGTDFGFDFNPTVDRIRLVSNLGQNLRLNPNDGTLAATDGILTAGSSITGAAYTNNFAGATTTTLFDIDTQNNMLYKQDPPNNGTLTAIGALGVNAAVANGFDIGSTSGTAYALLTVSGVTKVYTINLTTGAAIAGATLTGTVKAFTLGLGF
ncbi:hypothetical protein ACVW0P_004011 [Mucilaginibacter sp. UYNi724]